MQMRQTPQQGANGNLPLQASQRRPQTVMDALAKGQMLILLVCQIQHVGSGNCCGSVSAALKVICAILFNFLSERAKCELFFRRSCN